MHSELVINIDIIKALGLIFSIIGASTIGAWYASGKFRRIDENLRLLEKITEDLKIDMREYKNKNDTQRN